MKKQQKILPRKKNKCFQYALRVALNQEKNKKVTETNKNWTLIESNWKGIDFPSEKDDRKNVEKKM